jgi:segregation and condensation protein B
VSDEVARTAVDEKAGDDERSGAARETARAEPVEDRPEVARAASSEASKDACQDATALEGRTAREQTLGVEERTEPGPTGTAQGATGLFEPAFGDRRIAAADSPELPGAPAADPQLKAIIEALVFASPEPLTPKTLFKLLESEPKEDVELALASLQRDYDGRGGLQLVEVAGGYQIVTRTEMHEWVRRLFHERRTQKLSVQALETLAVIAYKQPVTAPEIAEIRGVNTAGVLSTLLERHLIKISGRKPVVGRPFLYSTTREFLIRFGLRDLSDLPKVEDMADVLGFEPPAGLADSGPSEGRLPLELEGENDSADNAGGATPRDKVPPKGEQVH